MRHEHRFALPSLLAAALPFLLAGCVTPGLPEGVASNPETEMMCIRYGRVADWYALDDRTLLVWTANRRRAYRVELVSSIFGLERENKLAFLDQNRDGQICTYGRDAVLTDSPQSPATIASIRYLSEARTRELMPAKKCDKHAAAQCSPAEDGDAASGPTPEAKPEGPR